MGKNEIFVLSSLLDLRTCKIIDFLIKNRQYAHTRRQISDGLGYYNSNLTEAITKLVNFGVVKIAGRRNRALVYQFNDESGIAKDLEFLHANLKAFLERNRG